MAMKVRRSKAPEKFSKQGSQRLTLQHQTRRDKYKRALSQPHSHTHASQTQPMSFNHLVRRNLATAATPKSVRVGVLLSRAPIVTQDLTKLETQYYEYQSELERRLMWTFPQYFYFKKGTLAERRFLAVQKGPVSKQPGVWFTRGVPDIKHNRERSQKQEVVLPTDSGEGTATDSADDISRPVAPNTRVTEADKQGDVTSLERQLARTLYLVVKNPAGSWCFPSFPVSLEAGARKPLHVAAEDSLRALGGENINTWTVSNTPAGVLRSGDAAEFLVKSHILAGRFELQQKRDYVDFAWLCKDEVAERVGEAYFKETGFLLADI